MTGPAVNTARGEVALRLGRDSVRLCLTLGALAELESALGCDSISDLQVRLGRLGGGELLTVLDILVRAGGGPPAGVSLAAVHPGDAARAVGEAFRVALA